MKNIFKVLALGLTLAGCGAVPNIPELQTFTEDGPKMIPFR